MVPEGVVGVAGSDGCERRSRRGICIQQKEILINKGKLSGLR